MLHFDAKEANSIHRPARSGFIKGLDAEEGIFITIMTIALLFFVAVLMLLKIKYVWLLIVPVVLVNRFVVGLLRNFHKTERPGFLVSFLSYHFYQPKKIYARKSKNPVKRGK